MIQFHILFWFIIEIYIKLWYIFSVRDRYCTYFEKNKSNVQYPSWNKQLYNSKIFNFNQTFNLLYIKYFVEMNIALVISFFFMIFLFYLHKIYLHLHIQYVIRIVLCIFCLYARANMPRKPKPSINARANTFRRYSMDAKDKVRVWRC